VQPSSKLKRLPLARRRVLIQVVCWFRLAHVHPISHVRVCFEKEKVLEKGLGSHGNGAPSPVPPTPFWAETENKELFFG